MKSTLIFYFPHLMVGVFFACVASWSFPAKGRFLIRAVAAATVAVLISHLNRVFNFYPSHPYFPSGHMTLSLSVAVSLGLLRPWTLAITIPILILFAIELVAYGFHTIVDVLGSIPLVVLVYASVFRSARWPVSRPLDSRAGSH